MWFAALGANPKRQFRPAESLASHTKRSVSTIRLLVQAGAKTTECDRLGITPLMCLTDEHRAEIPVEQVRHELIVACMKEADTLLSTLDFLLGRLLHEFPRPLLHLVMSYCFVPDPEWALALKKMLNPSTMGIQLLSLGEPCGSSEDSKPDAETNEEFLGGIAKTHTDCKQDGTDNCNKPVLHFTCCFASGGPA
jgi:hypothetical protein